MVKTKITVQRSLLAFLLAVFSGIVCLLSFCGCAATEELITTSASPDNTYTLEAYLVNAGATVDFSVKVYITDDAQSEKILIYNKYHESDAEINWISNDTVSINGVTLDLSKNETYDWRND